MNKVSGEILEELRDSMAGRRYRHFKGRIYIVTDLAVNNKCFTDPLVTWCRPLSMFTSDVDRKKYPNVKQKRRFEPLSRTQEDNTI